MVTVSTPTKPSSTRRSLRSSSAKSGSATPARKARASRKAQAARPSSGSRSAEETSGAETKIAEPATQKATAEPGRVEEPDKAPDNRTGTLVTTVDKYNDLTGRSVAAIDHRRDRGSGWCRLGSGHQLLERGRQHHPSS